MILRCTRYIWKENKLLLKDLLKLKNKNFKHMTAISKTVYFDVLEDM